MSKMRFGWYVGASTALAASCVLSAFYQRPNFYSAVVYLAQSNFCMLVLLNFTFFIYASFYYGLTRLFFGHLRPTETEQLTERAWIAATETCLAMTIFRGEIGTWFIIMFTALVSGKVWGWIADGRVEILEQQPPANPRLFHTRLCAALTFGFFYTMWLFGYCARIVIQDARPSMMVMFLFEFAILNILEIRTSLRYLLTMIEQSMIHQQTHVELERQRRAIRERRAEILRRREAAAAAGETSNEDDETLPSEDDIDEMDIEVPGWEAKGELVLWLDLMSASVRLIIYAAFFMVLTISHGFPIHIMRDLFISIRDFLKQAAAITRYRRAMRDMNQYPDATEAELSRDNTCIICREEMRPWNAAAHTVDRVRPKKLPCGHTLHLGCLKSWLERQQVCPTCRSPVSGPRTAIAARQQNQLPGVIGIPAAGNGVHQPPHAQAGDQHQGGQPNLQQGNQGAEAARPGRFLRIGPVQVGFGVHMGQGPDPVRQMAQALNVPVPPVPEADHEAGGHNAPSSAAHTPPPPPAANGDHLQEAADLLARVEDALQRELNALRGRAHELQTAQLLAAELRRIRQRTQQAERAGASSPAQQHPQAAMSAFPGLTPVGLPMHQGPPLAPFAPMSQVPQRVGSLPLTRHIAQNNAAAIPAGSPNLPEGVVLPPGWSLTPLQRVDGNGMPTVQPGPAPSSPAGGRTPADLPVPTPTMTLAEENDNQESSTPAVSQPSTGPTAEASQKSREAQASASETGAASASEEPALQAPHPHPTATWSFGQINADPDTTPGASASTNPVSATPSSKTSDGPSLSNTEHGRDEEPEGMEHGSGDKGKAKAVYVEEAEDSE